MFEKSNQFLDENVEKLLMALEKDPVPVLSAFFKHPNFSLNYEIPGIIPLDGPPGVVYYVNISKDERESTA